MKTRLSLFSALTVVAALFAATPKLEATPPPGRYVGTLRTTKTLPPYYTNALSVTTTVRVVARVAQERSGRTLTILAAVAEAPLESFDTEKSVIRGTFTLDGDCLIQGPPFLGTPGQGPDYLGTVTENPLGFRLRHDNIPFGVEFFLDPHLTQPITDFDYRFRRAGP